MKTFVLIMLFCSASHSSIATVEFNSQQACEAARDAASAQVSSAYAIFGPHQLYALCTPK